MHGSGGMVLSADQVLDDVVLEVKPAEIVGARNRPWQDGRMAWWWRRRRRRESDSRDSRMSAVTETRRNNEAGGGGGRGRIHSLRI